MDKRIPEYTIITRNKVLENNIEDVLKEQNEKMEILGLNEDGYICHFFNAGPEYKIVSSIDEAIEEFYNHIKLPVRATAGSAGHDFFAPFDFTIEPGETLKIPTGIRCEIKNGWYLAIYPRSGHGFKYGISLVNSVGIIDRDFAYSDNEGHIMIKIANDSCINKTYSVPQGQGFSQGIFMPYGLTMTDNVTEIRNGGFGSTTKEIHEAALRG